jgi:hypothetical protein
MKQILKNLKSSGGHLCASIILFGKFTYLSCVVLAALLHNEYSE